MNGLVIFCRGSKHHRDNGIWGKESEVYFNFKWIVPGAKAFSAETVLHRGQQGPAKRDA